MRALNYIVAALLLLAAPPEEARAQSAPRITTVGFSDPDNPLDIYPLDHMVKVRVVFDKPVEVTGRPQLTVEVGSQRRNLDLLIRIPKVPGDI